MVALGNDISSSLLLAHTLSLFLRPGYRTFHSGSCESFHPTVGFNVCAPVYEKTSGRNCLFCHQTSHLFVPAGILPSPPPSALDATGVSTVSQIQCLRIPLGTSIYYASHPLHLHPPSLHMTTTCARHGLTTLPSSSPNQGRSATPRSGTRLGNGQSPNLRERESR